MVIGAAIVASLLGVRRADVHHPSGRCRTPQVNDRVLVEAEHHQAWSDHGLQDPGRWLTEDPAKGRGPIGEAFQFIGVLPDAVPSTDQARRRVPGDRVAYRAMRRAGSASAINH